MALNDIMASLACNV